ncbi:hypothetical protein [Winogradskyella sp.]|uniref:hypothetical protein n=1 Tax=Winogradskyella sp. TaxID=1883156 RepID=UPI003BAD4767
MKKLLLLAILCISSLCMSGQGNNDDNPNSLNWLASAGLNAINSQGTQSPVGKIGDWAINIPISLAIEARWADGLAIEQAFTINSFAEGESIDGVELQENFTYFSFDSHAKYYFGKHILPSSDWIDFYGNAGLGVFSIEDLNASFNLGGGVLVWLNKKRTIGIRAQVIGKFALNHSQRGINNNHYQTHIQAVFAL